MKLSFENIVDKHKDIPAIVSAHGPSLNMYLHKLNQYKKQGFILFGCNEWFDFYDTKPHYWVLANSQFTVGRVSHIMNNFSVTVLYANTVDKTDEDWIEKNLKVDKNSIRF